MQSTMLLDVGLVRLQLLLIVKFLMLPHNDYFEYFGLNLKLHISPSNMTNQNTPESMGKIKQPLFKDLCVLPRAS